MTWSSRVLVALVAWGALSFGAVYPWGYWPLAIGAAAVGIWAIAVTGALGEPKPRAVAIALGCVAVALFVQIVPLPYAWFQTISPAGDQVLRELRVGWSATAHTKQSLSLAPDATLVALAVFLALGLMLVGLMRAVSYMRLSWIVTQLTTLGVVLAVFGIVQRAMAGASDFAVYGFWKPSGFATPFGPFINRNHFAGWMVLVLPLAVAWASASAQSARGPFLRDWRGWLRWLTTTDASRFVFAGVAVLLMATALVMTGSRSGLISLAVAMSVLAVFAVRRTTNRLRRLLPMFYFTVLLVAAVGWAGVERTAARFDHAASEMGERMAAWRDTGTIIRDFPIAGTGVGAYGSAMLKYQTAARHSIYEQAHNEYLQIAAEGGLLLTIPVVVLLIVLVGIIRYRFRTPEDPQTFWLRAGVVAGLVGIAAQSLLEFSLQMPGNALLCVVLLAIALHRPSTRSHAHRV